MFDNLPRSWAVPSQTVADARNGIDGWLAERVAYDTYKDIFLINLGVAEMSALPDSATWCDNYLYIVNVIIAKYGDPEIRITYPWKRGATANANTVASRINSIIATDPVHLFAGDDERVWLEGGDDGATMTIDGVHYSAAGHAAKVTAVRAALGL